jgi:fused signal recognition particle receptor
VGSVDEDALAWAREAYARLRAQQEADRRAPEPPAPSAAPPPEPAGPSAPAPPEAPEPQEIQPPEPPLSESEPAAPTPAPSLLEQAAAQRQARLEQITAAPPAAPVAGLPPAPVPAPTPTPAAPTAPTPTAPAPPAPAAEEADPQLGAFDEDFTWSAEVLAAQGRSVDQMSVEEIDWLGRLRRGLEKTRRGFVTQLLANLGDDPLTPEVLDDLESTLLRADVGVQATDRVLEALRRRLNEEVVDPAEGIRFLKEQLRGLLDAPIQGSGQPLLAPRRDRLNVWLLVGVNGVGKTTTLGKLANLAVRSGYSCLIAAADTFRAAAVQQVSVWGERSGVPVVANPSANADPAAVVYDAIGAARSRGTELVLVDTAGRLQTKHNLMEELNKVRRIIDKLAPDAAVESLLVLDASQGQNGLRQAMAFASAAGLTGVVLTKLDGSARGGVALAVASEAGLPIRFVGAGEGIRDLRPFNSFEFVEALLSS